MEQKMQVGRNLMDVNIERSTSNIEYGRRCTPMFDFF
jgi:hypothetical protein